MAALEVPTFIPGSLVGSNDAIGRDIRALKSVTLVFAATADAGDTCAFDLASVGGSRMLGFLGFVQTTDGSVIVEEVDTSAVSGTTVTFTIVAGTDNDPRIIKIYYV